MIFDLEIEELNRNIGRARAILKSKRDRLAALETAIATDVELIAHYKRLLLAFERNNQ